MYPTNDQVITDSLQERTDELIMLLPKGVLAVVHYWFLHTKIYFPSWVFLGCIS